MSFNKYTLNNAAGPKAVIPFDFIFFNVDFILLEDSIIGVCIIFWLLIPISFIFSSLSKSKLLMSIDLDKQSPFTSTLDSKDTKPYFIFGDFFNKESIIFSIANLTISNLVTLDFLYFSVNRLSKG